jgi:hypothetical protein
MEWTNDSSAAEVATEALRKYSRARDIASAGTAAPLAVRWTGGRAKGDDDTNDCAVRALAVVSELTYEQARAMLERECGRKRREGVYTTPLRRLLDTLARPIQFKGTLGAWCRSAERGVFYVLVRNHAFAIIDGRIIDNGAISGARCRIHGIWKFAD